MINLSAKTKIIITLIWVAILLVSGIVPMFPIITFNGKDIRLFAPGRIGTSFIFAKGFIRPQGRFWGNVMDTTVLETEYGQITLEKSARIEAADNTVFQILAEVFEEGQAVHNLVIEGIEIPQIFTVSFIDSKLRTLALNQEVIVSGIPSKIRNIYLYSYEHRNHLDAITIAITIIPDNFTLSDSTELDVSQFGGVMYIHRDEGLWTLDCRSKAFVAAMRPGETEYTRYKSITFEKDWGSFISGEIFEEQQ